MTKGSTRSRFPEPQQLGFRLLDWFAANRRDLPWRANRDPYRIWISEIMLQQTRVDTVVPYYERFMQTFPTVDALAAASETDVLALWEGLGYYSRARNLHKAAQEIVTRFDGELPETIEQLRTLPGIGPYTAAAIVSIAFNEPAAAVDGNVLRVIARLAGITDTITRAPAKRKVEQEVLAMIPPDHAALMTEALMELGALVCLPRNPACDRCPWQDDCIAKTEGMTDDLPVRAERTPPRIVEGVVAVVANGDRLLVRRRPPEGLLAGMWEFPWIETGTSREGTDGGERSEREFERELLNMLHDRYSLRARITGQLSAVRHVFSHLEWHLTVFECDVEPTDRRISGPDGKWVNVRRLEQLPFGRAHRRIADEWLAGGADGGGGVGSVTRVQGRLFVAETAGAARHEGYERYGDSNSDRGDDDATG